MTNKVDLKKEVGSLDMLISALSDEIDKEPARGRNDESSARLLEEMQEALSHLRRERGLRRMWLTALGDRFTGRPENNGRAHNLSAGPRASAIY
jgi:hypothetical protein